MKLPNLYPSDEPHRYDERFGKASILMAARCCLIVCGEPGCFSIKAATGMGVIDLMSST